MKILFNARDDQREDYENAVKPALAAKGIKAEFVDQSVDPKTVSYILHAPNGPVQDLSPYSNVKLVQSLWAGVEKALENETLTQPLARMVEDGMSQGMADYVLGHILRHHLGTDFFATQSPGEWHEERIPPLSSERVIGFLGFGALGKYCAEKTYDFGFQVSGWSKNPKSHDAIDCYHGQDGLKTILAKSDIIVLLMPDTSETRHIINADTLSWMKKGGFVINPGRGPLINDEALIEMLDSEHLAGATLDVFDTEPLPKSHPFWTHPKILVTPHVASATRAITSAKLVAENIARCEAGDDILHLVDRQAGY